MRLRLFLSLCVLLGLFIFGGWFALRDRAVVEPLRLTPKTEAPNRYQFSIAINRIKLNVDVAKTPEQRAKGLSGRTKLAEDQGMLFIFDKPGKYSFWMKDMEFAIDIIWISADRTIVDISKNLSPDSFPQTFQPAKPAQYVLEVNAGFADRNNINIGEAVDFSELFSAQKLKELVFTEDAKNHQVIVLSKDGEIVKRIQVGKEPHDIAVSPDQKFVATGNFGDGTVSIINTKTLSVENTIKTGKGAHGVAFGPDGKFLFVANAKEDTLSVIDTSNLVQGGIKQAAIQIGAFPEYVGVTKDSSKIFTTNLAGRGSVTILENKGLKSEVLRTIDLGIDPHGWAISPDGSKVVITNLGSNFTYLLDAKTFDEIEHIDTGAATEFAAFKDNNELWVTDIGAHYISIIDVAKNEVLEKIAVGETPHGISFSQDPEGENLTLSELPYGAGKTLAFVPLYESGEVVIIDTATREVIKRVKVGQELHNSVVVKLNSNEK